MEFEFSEQGAKEIIEFMKITKANFNNFTTKGIKPIVKPSELDISATDLFQWSKKGLIDLKSSEKGKKSNWAKLNLSEVVWLKLVKELRRIGFPFNEIKQLNKSFHRNLFGDLNEYKEDIIKALERKMMKKELLESVKDLTNILVENHTSKENNTQIVANMLGIMVSEILLNRCKISVLIYFEPWEILNEKGEMVNYNFKFLPLGFRFNEISQKTIDDVKIRPHINICINELIAEFVGSELNESVAEEFGLISATEVEIIKAIRDCEVKEIIIKKDQQENLTMTTTSAGELSIEKVQLIKRILCMNEYDEVRVVFRNEKNIYLENKIKRKL